VARSLYSTLPRALKRPVYAVALAVLVTGVAWIALHAAPRNFLDQALSRQLQSQLLKLHGAAAMLALISFGGLLAAHVLPALKRPENRNAGITLLACAGILTLTGWGLYYVGDEELRGWASDLHVVIGVAAPLICAWHLSYRKRGAARHAFLPTERSGES
jgi:uncharacterized membrane protein